MNFPSVTSTLAVTMNGAPAAGMVADMTAFSALAVAQFAALAAPESASVYIQIFDPFEEQNIRVRRPSVTEIASVATTAARTEAILSCTSKEVTSIDRPEGRYVIGGGRGSLSAKGIKAVAASSARAAALALNPPLAVFEDVTVFDPSAGKDVLVRKLPAARSAAFEAAHSEVQDTFGPYAFGNNNDFLKSSLVVDSAARAIAIALCEYFGLAETAAFAETFVSSAAKAFLQTMNAPRSEEPDTDPKL